MLLKHRDAPRTVRRCRCPGGPSWPLAAWPHAWIAKGAAVEAGLVVPIMLISDRLFHG